MWELEAAGNDEVQVARSLVPGVGPTLPVITLRSPESGPVAVVTANLHGDECTGVSVVHALLDLLKTSLLRGTVHLYPSLNPAGLEHGSRHLPGQDLDPNRCFPGRARGGVVERHAARVWKNLMAHSPDLVIDLHADSCRAIPYAIVDRVVRGDDSEALARRCVTLAEASGLTVLREYPVDRYVRFGLDQSLPGALVNGPGVAAVTLEVGPRLAIDPIAVQTMCKAARGILGQAGMVLFQATNHGSRLPLGPWRRESGPRTARSGILVPLCAVGSAFESGDPLAEVRGLDGGVREVLHAREKGHVVALPELAQVTIGVACCTVAVPDVS